MEMVQLIGVKDGVEHALGEVPMPARMKARLLAAETFGAFEIGDGSDADLCFGAMEELLAHLGVAPVLGAEVLAEHMAPKPKGGTQKLVIAAAKKLGPNATPEQVIGAAVEGMPRPAPGARDCRKQNATRVFSLCVAKGLISASICARRA